MFCKLHKELVNYRRIIVTLKKDRGQTLNKSTQLIISYNGQYMSYNIFLKDRHLAYFFHIHIQKQYSEIFH